MLFWAVANGVIVYQPDFIGMKRYCVVYEHASSTFMLEHCASSYACKKEKKKQLID